MVKVRERADGRKEIRETIDGVRRSFYGKTSKEVRHKYRDALATPKEEAPAFEPKAITVRELFRQYDEVARDTMKRRSLETYRSIARFPREVVKYKYFNIGSIEGDATSAGRVPDFQPVGEASSDYRTGRERDRPGQPYFFTSVRRFLAA